MVTVYFVINVGIVSSGSIYDSSQGAAFLALGGAFVLLTLVDILSQCSNDPIPDTPVS